MGLDYIKIHRRNKEDLFKKFGNNEWTKDRIAEVYNAEAGELEKGCSEEKKKFIPIFAYRFTKEKIIRSFI